MSYTGLAGYLFLLGPSLVLAGLFLIAFARATGQKPIDLANIEGLLTFFAILDNRQRLSFKGSALVGIGLTFFLAGLFLAGR